VPEHPLNDFHVRAGRDGEGGRCMPQVVRRDPTQADRFGGGLEDPGTEIGVAQWPAVRSGEDERVAWPAGDMGGEFIDEEPGDRH